MLNHNTKHTGSYYKSISASGNKSWEGSVTLDGKRYRKRGFSKKRLAEIAITEIVERYKQNQDMSYENKTLAQYLDVWAPTSTAKPLRAKTIDSRRVCINRMLPYIGNKALPELNSKHIESMYKNMEKSYKPNTVRQVHAILRKALNDAVDDGYILYSPMTRVKGKPTGEKADLEILTEGEVGRLLEQNDEWTPLFQVLIHTGMRRGEALGLKWDKVDLDSPEPSLRVEEVLLSTRDGNQFGEPKTKGSRRTIFLNSYAVEGLKTARKSQNISRLKMGADWVNTGLVFTNIWGKALDPSSANRALKRSLKLAGVTKNIRLHDLRHTCATLMVQNGVVTKQVQGVLGHANYATTMDMYVHNTDETLKEATDALEVVFDRASKA